MVEQNEESRSLSSAAEEALEDARLALWALAAGGYQAERLPVWESGDPVRWRWLGPWGAERFHTTVTAEAEVAWVPPLDGEMRDRLRRERDEWVRTQVRADQTRWEN